MQDAHALAFADWFTVYTTGLAVLFKSEVSENFIFIYVVYKHDLPSGGVNGSTSLSTYFMLCYARYVFSRTSRAI